MIEINLLPGTGKKAKGKGASINLAGALSGALAQVKDPYLLSAFAAVILAVVGVGGMFTLQSARAASVEDRLQKAQQDSIRFAAVVREKRKAEAARDSIGRQLELIRSIDNNRFVWPHLMEELSRALPPYTWINSLVQTNTTPVPSTPTTQPGAKGAKPDTAKKAGEVPQMHLVNFRIIGNTVDLQALTRFMRQLEASPFIENVQLLKTISVISEGKEITEFQLEASYEKPDPSVIRTVSIPLSVR